MVRAVLWALFFALSASTPVKPRVKSHALVVSTTDEVTFRENVSRPNHVFVKFFHPSCPHCQAMAKDFEDLARLIQAHNHDTATSPNHTITIMQVDASLESNDPVINANAAGFPTLKLFRNGSLVTEYFGPRKTSDMHEFLIRSLALADRPVVSHLHTRRQLESFLQLAGDRPVVVSLFQPRAGTSRGEDGTHATDYFPDFIHISEEEWDRTTEIMHDKTAPQTVFATVANPDFLVHLASSKRFNAVAARHSVSPLLAAATRADNFNVSAEWYFPGVRDGESVSSFMHTAVIPEGEHVVLTKHNAPHILETTRPLAFAFGSAPIPGRHDDSFLYKAGTLVSKPRMLPVYAHIGQFKHLAEHVGLDVTNVTDGDSGDTTRWESEYVIYRFGSDGPVTSTFSTKDGKSVKDWLETLAKGLNKTNVETRAGHVLELDARKWKSLFQFDGRGVILELYPYSSKFRSWRRSSRTSQRVAQLLKAYAGSIAVARLGVSSKLPSWPTLPKEAIKSLPRYIWLAPAQTPVLYNGVMSARGLARFAREMSGLDEGTVNWSDCFAAFVFMSGVLLLASGILISRFGMPRRGKREHVT